MIKLFFGLPLSWAASVLGCVFFPDFQRLFFELLWASLSYVFVASLSPGGICLFVLLAWAPSLRSNPSLSYLFPTSPGYSLNYFPSEELDVPQR